jgi:hypothetical protein
MVNFSTLLRYEIDVFAEQNKDTKDVTYKSDVFLNWIIEPKIAVEVEALRKAGCVGVEHDIFARIKGKLRRLRGATIDNVSDSEIKTGPTLVKKIKIVQIISLFDDGSMKTATETKELKLRKLIIEDEEGNEETRFI